MTNLDTPKNKTDKTNKKFVNNVKKAAAILFTALGITVAGQQSANAQELDFGSMTSTEVEKKKAEGKKLDKENAENLEVEKDLDAQIASLQGKKGDKQPPKEKGQTITRNEAAKLSRLKENKE